MLPNITEAMPGAWFLAPTVPDPAALYDESYFRAYQVRDRTEMGSRLTAARVQLVKKFTQHPVVDIGVGGGRFMDAIGARGHDVNPAALEWMNGRHWDLSRVPVLTFWDSLEHMADPGRIIALSDHWVFCSLPIFSSLEHVISSKHLKPNEHLWYFTFDGLVSYMRMQGFQLIESNHVETDLGREDIMSFAFRRIR